MADTPFTVAAGVLAAAAGFLTSPPARLYVSNGQPVHDLAGKDCAEQLCTWVVRFGDSNREVSPPGQSPRVRGAVMHHVTVGVELVYCDPPLDSRGRPPAPGVQEAAAQRLVEDAFLIRRGLVRLAQGAGLSAMGCPVTAVSATELPEPQGGAGAARLTVTVGFDPGPAT